MTVEQFRKHMAESLPVANGSETHLLMHEMAQEALRVTAINQQKFSFGYLLPQGDEKPRVQANRGFSLVGDTQMNLGIAKPHFEIGAGKTHFQWA